jgi:hypothetical protein
MKWSENEQQQKTQLSIFYLLVIIIFLVVIFIVYPDLFFHFSTKIPKAKNLDAQHMLSIVHWTFHPGIHGIYNLPFFYPLANLRASNPPLFFQGGIFKAFDWIGLNTEASYNLYIILAFLLGAYGCFLLCREFTDHFLIPVLVSAIYIIHQINFLFINWLNFISSFFFPFILFCFVRYLKTKKERYIISTTVLMVIQISASLHYGFHVWVFFIPLFLVFSLILGLLSFPQFKNWLLYLLIGALVVLYIFFPYLHTQSGLDFDPIFKIQSKDLIKGTNLFHYSKITDVFFKKWPDISIYYFPGFVFLFLILFYPVSFISRPRNQYLVSAALFALSVLISLFVYTNHIVLDYLFLLLLTAVFLIIAINWRKIPLIEKVFILCFSVYMGMFIYFPFIPVLKSFSIYSAIQYVFPFIGTGLRYSQRVLFLFAPFMVVFAGLGAVRLFRFHEGNRYKKITIFAVIFIFIFLENIRMDRSRTMMEELPKAAKVYQKIPSGENQVLLEIPFYNWRSENIIYMHNQKFHGNPIINGKSTWPPKEYMKNVHHILTPKQMNFPKEQKLKLLIQDYSVSHIIYHWDLLKKIIKEEKEISSIRARLKRMKRFGRIVFQDEDYTILKLGEYFPIKKLIRTYSRYHLQNHSLQINLNSIYTGKIRIYLNGWFIQRRNVSGKKITIDLRHRPLEDSGNRIMIVFDKPVWVDRIAFEKKN